MILLLLVGSGLSLPALASPVAHDIQVVLTPADGRIEVIDIFDVSGRDRYVFKLAPWLSISSAWLDDTQLEVERKQGDYVIELPDRNRHQVMIDFSGFIPPRSAVQGAGASSGSDGIYLPAYEDWIAHDWSGPLSYRLKVDVPATHRAVATGRLAEESIEHGFYRAAFEARRVFEPPSLFAGPYQVRERQLNGLRLRTYFHDELAQLSDTYLDAAAGYIERYHKNIGSYPYADFHIISAPLPVGLGFPNLTYVGRRVLPLPFMRGRSLAHEVLHNWWGNGVVVDYASGNWAEGLTTYMADYALARDQGADAARDMRIKWLRDYAALPGDRDQPVRAFKSKSHQAAQVIGYNKVAFIFHMLSQEIGEAAFNDGLRRFWQQNKGKIAGWAELQNAFEQSAVRDLDWFFAQWLDRPGAPRLSLGAHRVEQVDEGFRITVDVVQPVSGYRFKLPLLLQTANGVERHEMIISEALTRLEWVTSARPQYLHFDPDSDLFRRLQQNEAPPIMRDVTLDTAAVTLIGSTDEEFYAAGRELAARLMDVEPRFDVVDLDGDFNRSLLLITSTNDLPAQLERMKLRQPAELNAQGTSAGAWTARLDSGKPVLIVSADNAEALRAMLRPLPHYGGRSYVLFDGARATDRGIWPIKRGPLFLDLTAN